MNIRDALDQLIREGSDPECADFLRNMLNADEALGLHTLEISRSVLNVAEELTELTTDATVDDVIRRALGVYRALVQHSQSGGKVVLKSDTGERVLKVRLRRVADPA